MPHPPGGSAWLECLYNFRGVAQGNAAGRHVFHYHRTGADDGVITDGHARQNDHTTTDPDIIADDNGARRRRARMVEDVVIVIVQNVCVWSDEAALAYMYRLVGRERNAIVNP